MSQLIREIQYSPPGPVARDFLKSEAFVKMIVGPVGSGKSVSAVIFLWMMAAMQERGPDGIRRTRFVIARNSYPQLLSTTIKSFFEWVPKDYGKATFDSPITFHVRAGDIDAEFLFLAMDQEQDVKKLLSLEVTYIWLNEGREFSKAIFDQATARVGRYPGKALGGCTRSGVIIDSNPFSTDHWLYRLFEEERPNGFELFRQPSGLSPAAENVGNLPKDYYNRITLGKDEDWIKVYVEGEYGHTVEGKAVYQQYRDSFHCAPGPIPPNPDLELVIAADFGLITSAAVIGQKTVEGRLLILDELISENAGVQRFAEVLASYVQTNYPEFNVGGCWADPAGGQRSLSNEQTALEIMSENTPWRWKPAPGDNNIMERLECVRALLNRNSDGLPALFISPRCKLLRQGFLSEYHFKTAKSGNGEVVHETPNKTHPFSDIHDALQYLVLSTGGMDAVLNRRRRDRSEPKKFRHGIPDPFDKSSVRRSPKIARGTGGDFEF